MKKLLFMLLATLFLSNFVWAADELKLKDENDKVNYSIGYQIGGDFVKQNIDLKTEIIVKGIQDAIKANKPLLTQEEMNKTLIDLKERIIAEQRQKESEAGLAFLADYRKKDGVVELPVGVLYREVTAGEGTPPTVQDTVTIHYITRTIDGQEVSSTYTDNQPKTYQIGRMMPGLRDVLLKMNKGSKWEVVVPLGQMSSTGKEYLGQGVLVYEIELVSIAPAPAEK